MYQVILLALVIGLDAAPAVQRRTPAEHARAGWDALNAGKAQEAADAFGEALKGAPEEPSVLLGAGVSAHLLGQADAARRFLVEAVKYAPAMTAASLLLGEVLYRGNDLNGAIQVYQQALAHAPDHPQLVAKLEVWR